MKFIRQATRRNNVKINALRIREFQRSAQFILLRPEKLLWNDCDDDAIVLAAWDGPCAVATMRAVVGNTIPEAENYVKCTVAAETDFPVMIFTSAATHWDYRGIGLNQLMRYYFLKIALDNKIQSLLSPMYEGAPRIRFMKNLGYKFNIPRLSWQNKLNPKATRILGVLERSMMPQAVDFIETHRKDIIKAYPWKGKRIRIKDPAFRTDGASRRRLSGIPF